MWLLCLISFFRQILVLFQVWVFRQISVREKCRLLLLGNCWISLVNLVLVLFRWFCFISRCVQVRCMCLLFGCFLILVLSSGRVLLLCFMFCNRCEWSSRGVILWWFVELFLSRVRVLFGWLFCCSSRVLLNSNWLLFGYFFNRWLKFCSRLVWVFGLVFVVDRVRKLKCVLFWLLRIFFMYIMDFLQCLVWVNWIVVVCWVSRLFGVLCVQSREVLRVFWLVLRYLVMWKVCLEILGLWVFCVCIIQLFRVMLKWLCCLVSLVISSEYRLFLLKELYFFGLVLVLIVVFFIGGVLLGVLWISDWQLLSSSVMVSSVRDLFIEEESWF